MATHSKRTRTDVHQTVTTRIVVMLETAQANGAEMPWCRPGVAHSRPTNVVSKQRYRGINVLSLWAVADVANYRTGLWATFRQWQEFGAQVRKGESATPVVFYKPLQVADEKANPANGVVPEARASGSDPTKTIRLVKGYWAFNADQVDNFSLPELPTDNRVQRVAHAETFFANIGVPIRHGGARAFYRPSDDFIQMPEQRLFRDTKTSTATEGYLAVLGHEAGHASGAKHRLNRDLSGRYGTAAYAVEELVAELTSAFLCADLGLTAQPRPDHAHYLANWLE